MPIIFPEFNRKMKSSFTIWTRTKARSRASSNLKAIRNPRKFRSLRTITPVKITSTLMSLQGLSIDSTAPAKLSLLSNPAQTETTPTLSSSLNESQVIVWSRVCSPYTTE